MSQPQPQNKKCLEVSSSTFITTTDVMNAINRSLQEMNQGEQEDGMPSGHFELQRRLPDGSTRKATPSEQAAADCQTRLQQASQIVASFTSFEEQYNWAESQRVYGNTFYTQEHYEMAIQVYLTCLPAVAQIAPGQVFGNNSIDDDEEDEDENTSDTLTFTPSAEHLPTNSLDRSNETVEETTQRLLLYCKIMNNLAQAALQLKWYRKAETFCTMALEYIHEQTKKEENLQFGQDSAAQLSKLYFRRAKAHRLRGNFVPARLDLDQASKAHHAQKDSSPEARAIQKEYQLLAKQASIGKKHKDMQKRALQNVMKSSTTDSAKMATRPTRTDENNGIFQESTLRSKKHSTLRAPEKRKEPKKVKTQRIDEPKADTAPEPCSFDPSNGNYWQYYLFLVGRVARSLLQLMGEDEDRNASWSSSQGHSPKRD